ncbi:MAG: TIGR01777 family oxidoreductase, partial [Sandaracinaceae bacterium]|nr:TIGR01777 family oxidoreductase [Sandaracinaceae bacterium]
KRQRIYESRVNNTRLLVQNIAKLEPNKRPRLLISASDVGYYGDRGEEELDESAPPGKGFLAEVCIDWEKEAMTAEALGLRVICLRIGLVMSSEGGALRSILPIAKAGLFGPIGSGKQFWPWIAIDDVIRGIEFVMSNEDLRGPINLVAPSPLRQGSFAQALGKSIGRPSFLPTPAWAVRFALGGFSDELLWSRRVVPAALNRAGFSFRYPRLEEALAHLIST